MKLTATNVEDVFKKCVYGKDSIAVNAISVHGVVHNFLLDEAKLEKCKEDIASMLDELPKEFRVKESGGCSFLQACMTKDGTHWGEHLEMELLFVLGLAIRKVKQTFPRDAWHLLPGGMPYYIVLEKPKEGGNGFENHIFGR